MKDVLEEMKKQTGLLAELNRNMEGLREDIKAGNREAMENSMKNVMAQVSGAFKGTPMEGMMAGIVSKMGGNHG